MLLAGTMAAICQLQALSPVGRCQTFDAAADSAANDAGIVGALDLTTGDLTAIATGFSGPHGMAFLPDAPVPEASTTLSFGLLLLLGFGGAVVSTRKKRIQAAA